MDDPITIVEFLGINRNGGKTLKTRNYNNNDLFEYE